MPPVPLLGDVVGAPFERHNTHRSDFDWSRHHSRFTDDTVRTLATCQALLEGQPCRQALCDRFDVPPPLSEVFHA